MATALLALMLFIAAALSYLLKKLTLTGSITGFIVSSLIAMGTCFTGIALLAVFFILSTLSTQTKHERRTAGQVIANGGVAAILGACAWLWPQNKALLEFMLAGSLASATADTLSSELGTRYGRKFFNIITLKNAEKGLNGVISLEGTMIGIIGAAFIGITYSIFNGFNVSFAYILIAGFTGNLVDSVLGATLERKGIIGNNVVNFINTLAAAFMCFLL